MELFVLAVIISVVLTLAPVRFSRRTEVVPPPAICRVVDIDAIRLSNNFYLHYRPATASAQISRPAGLGSRPAAVLEEDNIERLCLDGQTYTVILRNDVLVLRAESP